MAIYVPQNLGLSLGLAGNSEMIVNLGMTHSTLYFSCAKHLKIIINDLHALSCAMLDF